MRAHPHLRRNPYCIHSLPLNPLHSLPPKTELGYLVEMTSGFFLDTNSLSYAVPTQLGMLVKITSGYQLYSNKLCNDLPTQVAGLSSQVTSWRVTTGNSIGTSCCSDGYEWTGSCTACSAGRFSASGASSCTVCDAGKKSKAAASACETCEGGTYSLSESVNCTTCAGGTAGKSARES